MAPVNGITLDSLSEAQMSGIIPRLERITTMVSGRRVAKSRMINASVRELAGLSRRIR